MTEVQHLNDQCTACISHADAAVPLHGHSHVNLDPDEVLQPKFVAERQGTNSLTMHRCPSNSLLWCEAYIPDYAVVIYTLAILTAFENWQAQRT